MTERGYASRLLEKLPEKGSREKVRGLRFVGKVA